jgi:hypothetical protein
MTTLAAHRPVPLWTPSVRQLGAFEARKMLRHLAYPIAMLYLAAIAVGALVTGDVENVANYLYSMVFLGLLMIYAPATIVVANRVAAATYRRSTRELFDGTPVDSRHRTVGVIVGLVRGPVLVGAIGAVALWILGAFTTATTSDPTDAVVQRTPLEYLQVPALILGAGLLGIAVARWLPWPGAMPVVVLAVLTATEAMYKTAGPDNVIPTVTWFAPWTVWAAAPTGIIERQLLGQEMAHLAYLLGLGCLAGVAALLRTGGPRRVLWIVAAGALVVTVLGAWLQLG